jgi:hypothetical protein
MIYALNGTPGQTKTAQATHLALKKYKKDNVWLRLFEVIYFLTIQLNKIFKTLDLEKIKMLTNPHVKVYSNYPILLDKKRKITTNLITLDDLNYNHKFEKGTMIILDEIQFYGDSTEYKKLAESIMEQVNFMQTHRHCHVSHLILISQHPSRIPKFYRVLCEEFRKQKVILNVQLKVFGKVLINGFTIKKEIIYYEFEEYNTSVSGKKKRDVPVDFKRKIFIMNNEVFNRYDNIYLSAVVKGKPKFIKKQYNTLIMDKEELSLTFPKLAQYM